jgi:hypothetical protein
MMTLPTFLSASGIELDLKDCKMHLAKGRAAYPLGALDHFFDDTFKEWQEHQHQRNFQRKRIISLVYTRPGEWLFAGIYNVLGPPVLNKDKIHVYSTELVAGMDDLVGRLVFQFDRGKLRQSYLRAENYAESMIISEFLPRRMEFHEFPGYNTVRISFHQLQMITQQHLASWHAALSNVKGVYLITDSKNGKQYVGSATGESMIWQRWCDYAKNGHGGNVELKKRVLQKKSDFADHFFYSILEIADTHATDEYIVERESHWKTVLQTREFGYNAN